MRPEAIDATGEAQVVACVLQELYVRDGVRIALSVRIIFLFFTQYSFRRGILAYFCLLVLLALYFIDVLARLER